MATNNDGVLKKEQPFEKPVYVDYSRILHNLMRASSYTIEKYGAHFGASDYMREQHRMSHEMLRYFREEAILDFKNPPKMRHVNPVLQIQLVENMVKSQVLVPYGRDIFVDSNWMPNDFLLRQLLLRQGIYSGETALYLWDLNDQFPYNIYMTFRRGYRLQKNILSENVIPRQGNTKFLNSFVEHLDVPGTQKKISLYSKERCLVETLRDSTESEIVTTAYRRYLDSSSGTVGKLLITAQKLGAYSMVRNKLEGML